MISGYNCDITVCFNCLLCSGQCNSVCCCHKVQEITEHMINKMKRLGLYLNIEIICLVVVEVFICYVARCCVHTAYRLTIFLFIWQIYCQKFLWCRPGNTGLVASNLSYHIAWFTPQHSWCKDLFVCR